jgi:hypothetical protein
VRESGKRGAMFRKKVPKGVAPDSVGMIWLRNTDLEAAYNTGTKFAGFLGITPSQNGPHYGLRFAPANIALARHGIAPEDYRYTHDNRQLVPTLEWLTEGWQEGICPSQITQAFQDWNWKVITSNMNTVNSITSAVVGSEGPPPASRMYLDGTCILIRAHRNTVRPLNLPATCAAAPVVVPTFVVPQIGLPQAVAEVVSTALASRTAEPHVLARFETQDNRLLLLESALNTLRTEVSTEVLKLGAEVSNQREKQQHDMNALKEQNDCMRTHLIEVGDSNFQKLATLFKESQTGVTKMEEEDSDLKIRRDSNGHAAGSSPPSKKGKI